MKFATAAVLGLLLAEQTAAFTPFSPVTRSSTSSSSSLSMALDMPPPSEGVSVPAVQVDQPAPAAPVIQKSQYGPTDVRYSDFLKLRTLSTARVVSRVAMALFLMRWSLGMTSF